MPIACGLDDIQPPNDAKPHNAMRCNREQEQSRRARKQVGNGRSVVGRARSDGWRWGWRWGWTHHCLMAPITCARCTHCEIGTCSGGMPSSWPSFRIAARLTPRVRPLLTSSGPSTSLGA